MNYPSQIPALTLSVYEVSATHMVQGYDCTFEVFALDAGDALDKVERGGIFAANDAVLSTSRVAA